MTTTTINLLIFDASTSTRTSRSSEQLLNEDVELEELDEEEAEPAAGASDAFDDEQQIDEHEQSEEQELQEQSEAEPNALTERSAPRQGARAAPLHLLTTSSTSGREAL